MYRNYNENPCGKKVGDCVIRALTKALNKDWYTVYTELCLYGLKMCDMPSSNSVWHKYLADNGYSQKLTKLTVKEFCEEHPYGQYILATGSHVIAVDNGDYYDAWDSGGEELTSYFVKE